MTESVWNRDVTAIKGVSEKRAQKLNTLGIHTVGELILHLPREYRDYSKFTPVAALVPGQDAVCVLRVASEARISFVRKGLSIVSVRAQDETGALMLVWYNQPYRKNAVQAGRLYVVTGRAEEGKGGMQMVCPALEAVAETGARVPGILPVYPLTMGLSQTVLRSMIRSALDAALPARDELPSAFRNTHALCERNYALENIHFPVDMDSVQQARHRLSVEELLYFLLAMQLLGASRRQSAGRALRVDESMVRQYRDMLPFALTGAQKRVIEEISGDLRSPIPMSRLVQGDVGSGKTAVAFFALYAAMQNGCQGVMMAPTEILAQQHAVAARKIFGENEVCMLSASLNAQQRRDALEAVASAGVHIIIGTHALLQEKVRYADLGVVVTDEQHRFGVRQRAMLAAKGAQPHALIMSATPIPRTLALLLFGDLDISTLDERPPGRQKISTHVVGAHKREDMYRFIHDQVKTGKQAYIVCPLIESETPEDVLSVNALFAELSLKWKHSIRVELLHGKMPAREKDGTMRAFVSGDVGVLIATTVIEVGVDVPNATVMAIEGADRFGLAQLHQLRGRVGRGSNASFCFLRYDGDSVQTRERLRLLTTTDDGFAIAQKDLQYRGPGAFLGTRQHGAADNVLQQVDNLEVLFSVQKMVQHIMENPDMPDSQALCALARQRYDQIWDTWVTH